MLPRNITVTLPEWIRHLYGDLRAGYMEVRILKSEDHARPSFLPVNFDDGQLDEWDLGTDSKGNNVYFGVNPRRESGRGGSDNLIESPLLYIDIDLKDSHYITPEQKVLAMDAESLYLAATKCYDSLFKQCQELELHPLAVIYSGQGLQVYFLRSKVSTAEELTALNRALASRLGGDPKSTDPARILRFPGSTHWKNLARPLPVEVWYIDKARPTNSEEVLDRLLRAVATLQEQVSEAEQPPDTPLVESVKPVRGYSVIERYNARFGIEQELAKSGYTRAGDRFTRPGEEASGRDVALLMNSHGVLCSFHHSSNDPLVELSKSRHLMDPFEHYVMREHGGDRRAAVKAAARQLEQLERLELATALGIDLSDLPSASDIPPPEQHTGKHPEYSEAQKVELCGKSHWNIAALDTDLAHAHRYVALTGGNVGFNSKLGGFICWVPGEQRWVASEGGQGRARGDLIAQDYAQLLSVVMQPEVSRLGALSSMLATTQRVEDANALERALWKHTKARKEIESQTRQKAVLTAAQSMLFIDHTLFEAKPMKIGFANGVWDRAAFREPCREDYLLYHSPVAYYPDADLTDWLSVLLRITGGDEGLALTLQAVTGYAMSGQSSHRVIPWAYGPPGSGKSTYMDLLSTILGETAQAIDVAKLSSGAQRERLGADVWGKRLIVCHEAGRARLDAELLKTLSGGDRLPVRKLYSEAFTADPTHVLMMVSNDPPNLNVYDEGLRDRVLALPFMQRLDDPSLAPLLNGARLEMVRRSPDSALVTGFLRWAIEGLDHFYQTGEIYRAQATITATKKFWQDTDPLLDFWLDFGPERLLTGVTPSDLRQAYESWCCQADQSILTKHQWTQACGTVGLEQKHTGKGRYWKLVRLGAFPVGAEGGEVTLAQS